jgi:NTP pyrophosphatase (non-canonical NTP hydrolase)
MIETIQHLVDDSFNTATEKGWHDPGLEKSVGEDIALFHSEASEALEDFRSGHPVTEIYYETGELEEKTMGNIAKALAEMGIELNAATMENIRHCQLKDVPKPCGVPIELADIVIRIADFAKKHGIDLAAALNLKAEYNKTRSHRHGGKKL